MSFDLQEVQVAITLPVKAWSAVLQNLYRAPYSDVVELVNAITSQSDPQIEAAVKSASEKQSAPGPSAPVQELPAADSSARACIKH